VHETIFQKTGTKNPNATNCHHDDDHRVTPSWRFAACGGLRVLRSPPAACVKRLRHIINNNKVLLQSSKRERWLHQLWLHRLSQRSRYFAESLQTSFRPTW
jgi:hypothetical protein